MPLTGFQLSIEDTEMDTWIWLLLAFGGVMAIKLAMGYRSPARLTAAGEAVICTTVGKDHDHSGSG